MNRRAADNATKQKVISDLIKTAGGRAKLAASMVQPLRFRRDYTSIGRKTFLVEALPDGALPIYDKDPKATAFIIGEEGENILAIQKQIEPRYITPKVAEFFGEVEIRYQLSLPKMPEPREQTSDFSGFDIPRANYSKLPHDLIGELTPRFFGRRRWGHGSRSCL